MKILKRLLLLLLLVCAVTAAYFYIKFSTNNPETKTLNSAARKNAPGQFIKLTAGITHYQSSGPDSGKVIILVHGFSVPYYIWDATYDSLAQNGFHVIRYDEFGRGYSDRPDVNYDAAFYSTQLYDLITALKLRVPVNVAGLSFGGPVVTDFVVGHPELVDKVILIDPVYAGTRLGKSELVANYEMALDHEKQAIGQLDDVKYPDKFPGWADKYKVQMKYKGFRHALISTRKYYYGDVMISNYQRLGSLKKKVLLIWGKEDMTVPYHFSDSIRKIVPVDFFPVEDARHLPHLEKPGLVNQKIISFLKE
jgi:pimeloyl-ACP methyl ester carboxylesterase